jgi:flavin reductase (DIM6/NTAB) family NADH-FMN oxidoreductase RutF
MVLVCVNRLAVSHALISGSRVFCVNVLSLAQRELAEQFAHKTEGGDRHVEVAHRLSVTGSPVIDGALAYLDCRLAEEHTVGTHTIFVGSVVACNGGTGTPLGYFDGDYRDFGLHVS